MHNCTMHNKRTNQKTDYIQKRATYHSDKWLLLWNKILRISEKWLFLRLSQLVVDKLYLCWRERAARDWCQTTETGIKDKPLPELAPCGHGRDLGEVLLGELAAPESSDRFFHRFYCLLFYGVKTCANRVQKAGFLPRCSQGSQLILIQLQIYEIIPRKTNE